MQRFKSPQQAQLLPSVFDVIYNYFYPPKHKLQADEYRNQLDLHHNTWFRLVE